MSVLNVLLVEDSPDYASLVLRWLPTEPNPPEFAVAWTDSLAAGLARLDGGGIDLILLDLGLPDSGGLETFLALRAKAPDVPIIVLSSADSQALAIQTIQQGAQDYLVKSSCTQELLVRTLRHALVRHRSVTSRARTLESSNRARIIGVLGSSGGAGTTIVACVLAAELQHQSNQATLLMDLDANPGLVAFTMGADSQHSILDVLESADRLDQSLWEGLVTGRPDNLDILAAPETIANDDQHTENLLKAVKFASHWYRWIVMDLGRLNRTSKNLLGCAHDLILVSTQSIPALHQCKHAIETFHDLVIDRERVRLILNQKEDVDHLSHKEIENMFGVPIAAILPPAHDDLYNAYLNKRLPNVTGSFRLALSGAARKIAGLPEEAPKHSLLSLSSMRKKFQQMTKGSEDRLAS